MRTLSGTASAGQVTVRNVDRCTLSIRVRLAALVWGKVMAFR